MPTPLPSKDYKGDAETLKMPKDFQFGSATAAWQIEKEVNESNWSMFEKQIGKDGKPRAPPHLSACDAVTHFDEDKYNMKEMGFTIYRFSLHYSAIYISPNNFDENYMSIYVNWCDSLREDGIEPLVTLWHFEHPAFIEKQGGLLNPEFKDHFKNFVEFAVEKLKGHCKYFITINEPAVYGLMSYVVHEFPPGEAFQFKKMAQAVTTLMECHVIAYNIIKEKIPDAQVSFAKQIIPFYNMHKWSAIESLVSYCANKFFNEPVMDSILTGELVYSYFGITLFKKQIKGLKDSVDFIAINHYTSMFSSVNPKDWARREPCPVLMSERSDKYKLNDFGWIMIPESLGATMEWIHTKWNPRKLNMCVSEHGASDKNDEKRPWFTVDSLAYLKEVIENHNIPVNMYCHWSLLDNYEWAHGYTQHFGLVEIDENLNRKKRGTCDLLAKIAKNSK